MLGSGRFWMTAWCVLLLVVAAWGVLTFAFWSNSVRNLNALSVAALLVSGGAGVQASLGMRKTDPDDPL